MNNNQAAVQSVALMIHKVSQQGINSTNLAVMAHDVYHQGNQSVLGAGRPFSTTDKTNLLEILSDDVTPDLEIIESRCLAKGKETLMWYRPRVKTAIDVHGKTYTIPLPSLVFLLHKRTLYVTAYKGDKRPEKDTKLLLAGLPNISANGSWCSGGNSLPAHPNQAHIERIEEVFFLSPFTHFNGAAADLGLPDNMNAPEHLTAYCEALEKKRQFPVSKLATVPSRSAWNSDSATTMDDWFKHITRGR